MSFIFKMKKNFSKTMYKNRKEKSTFYSCELVKGSLFLYLNLNTEIDHCPRWFGLVKFSEWQKNLDSWTIDLEPVFSIKKFYEIALLIKKSKIKSEKEMTLLLKPYLEKELCFTNIEIKNKVEELKIVESIDSQSHFNAIYGKTELSAFKNGVLF